MMTIKYKNRYIHEYTFGYKGCNNGYGYRLS